MSASPARVKVACQRCHSRRVKCDRREDIACTRCLAARTPCEPIISRRGRHRKVRINRVGNEQSQTSPTASTTTPDAAESRPGHPIVNGNNAEKLSERSTEINRNSSPQTSLSAPFPVAEPGGRVPYVTDSSNLNYIIRELGNPFQSTADSRTIYDHLHRATVSQLDNPTIQHIESLHSSNLSRLKDEGALDLPSKQVGRILVDVFFEYVLHCYPILNCSEFLEFFEADKISLLLLNAIYLAATIYCPDSVIADCGFASKHIASLTFYLRAKSLYDAGYETDTLTVIRSTLLMAHWWGGLLEQKDPWYWLGVASGMAQAIGMHRLKVYENARPAERKVWRRVWWVLYFADTHTSMLLDRPPHIQDKLCNVPALTVDDFEEPVLSGEKDIFRGTPRQRILYAVYMVQLARILNDSYTIKFNEENNELQDHCLDQIARWSSALPPELRVPSPSTSSGSLWPALVQITYLEYQLCFYRTNPRTSLHIGPGSEVFETCTSISRILEDFVTSGTLYAAATHISPAVLSTVNIYISNIRKGSPGVRLICEHRARFCILILEKLQSSWLIIAPLCSIFSSLLEHHSARVSSNRDRGESGQRQETSGPDRSAAALGCSDNDTNILDHTDGSNSQFLEDDFASSFPSLFPFGNLFDDISFGVPVSGFTSNEQTSF